MSIGSETLARFRTRDARPMAAPAARKDAIPASLQVRAVPKVFQSAGREVVALDEVSLEVATGDFICLVGPSGCGKSTLLNLIAGLERPSQGQVLLGGRAVEGPRADRVVMFQESALFPCLSVQDNVAFGLRLAGASRRETRLRSARYLELVGLGPFDRACVP